MKISEKDIEYVARLAMLEVSEAEKRLLAADLSSMLEYVEQLNKIDVTGIAPTSQVVTALKPAVRDDRVAPRTGSSDAGRAARLFKVPKVITER